MGIGTQGLTVSGTLSVGLKLLLATAPVIATVVAIGAAVGVAIELVLPADVSRRAGNLIDRVYEVTVGLVLNTAVVAAMLTASEGGAMTPGQALGEGFRWWGRMLKYRILSGLWILLFTLLLIVPGIFKALSLAFVTVLAWKHRNNPMVDPLDESTRLTQGRRGELFAAMAVAFVAFVMVFAIPTVAMSVAAEAIPLLEIPSVVVASVSVNFAERLLDAAVVAAFLLLSNEVALGRGSVAQRE